MQVQPEVAMRTALVVLRESFIWGLPIAWGITAFGQGTFLAVPVLFLLTLGWIWILMTEQPSKRG